MKSFLNIALSLCVVVALVDASSDCEKMQTDLDLFVRSVTIATKENPTAELRTGMSQAFDELVNDLSINVPEDGNFRDALRDRATQIVKTIRMSVNTKDNTKCDYFSKKLRATNEIIYVLSYTYGY